ncbi:Gfo/Idh/MocA family protein [Bacillales bacterium AN1005]
MTGVAGTDKVKWGIMGTGWIASQFAKDLNHAGNAVKAAVGSRTQESAESFAAEYGFERSYGTYQEMLQDPELDIVYVATPHPFHKENVLACLEAGKAVLCEKPFTMNGRQLEQLVETARENKLFLMEGMWTRFLPPIVQARQWIAEGRIGDVRLVKADFGFRIGWEPEGRLLNPELGGGALLDAGVYPISFASMIFGEQPQHVWSTANIGETGVDEQFSVLLSYSEGRSASLHGAIRLNLSNEAVIYGTEGYIRLPFFLAGKEAYLHVNGQDEPEKFTDERTSIGYAFEAEEAGRCILEGKTESPTIPLDESLKIMKLMDTIRAQWGLRYKFE